MRSDRAGGHGRDMGGAVAGHAQGGSRSVRGLTSSFLLVCHVLSDVRSVDWSYFRVPSRSRAPCTRACSSCASSPPSAKPRRLLSSLVLRIQSCPEASLSSPTRSLHCNRCCLALIARLASGRSTWVCAPLTSLRQTVCACCCEKQVVSIKLSSTCRRPLQRLFNSFQRLCRRASWSGSLCAARWQSGFGCGRARSFTNCC